MTKTEKLKRCRGCRDDLYNGNNPHGVKECWALADMAMTRKKMVSTQQVPPWNQPSQWVPSCYHADGFIFVKPEVCR